MAVTDDGIKNKRSLIVGGTASIAPEIIDLLYKDGSFIDATYKTRNNIKEYNHYVEWINLDLYNKESIDSFFDVIKNRTYSTIVFLSVSSPGNFFENSEEDLANFYGVFLVNNMIVSKKLLNHMSIDGKMFYVSSIAANKPITQINYSTIKGALQSFYLSLSTMVKPSQSVICIVPGLIYDTPSFYDSEQMVYNNIDMLATKKEIAEAIVACGIKESGSLIRIGRDQ